MGIAIGLILIGLSVVWFSIPYSPLKSDFKKDFEHLETENTMYSGELFSESDFASYPQIIQKFITESGYIGKPKMSYMKMEYKNVAFKQAKNHPPLKIDYTLYSFVKQPTRMALIESSMFGIPFQGLDYYKHGTGGMKGDIAKSITLFHEKGVNMDKASLATYLSESLFVPSSLLQGNITFEEINKTQVKATITAFDISVSGVFNFNEQGEMTSFVTDDREATGTDGKSEKVRWTALCGEYKITENGIKLPTKFQAVWNYADGDFVYFDGKIYSVSYE